jgi:hypothetical protein
MKYSLDKLIDLQERGLKTPGQAARILTKKDNGRSAAYARFWLRHVALQVEKRIKRLKS